MTIIKAPSSYQASMSLTHLLGYIPTIFRWRSMGRECNLSTRGTHDQQGSLFYLRSSERRYARSGRNKEGTLGPRMMQQLAQGCLARWWQPEPEMEPKYPDFQPQAPATTSLIRSFSNSLGTKVTSPGFQCPPRALPQFLLRTNHSRRTTYSVF